jgi:hypothetical protein
LSGGSHRSRHRWALIVATWKVTRPYADPGLQRTAEWVATMMGACTDTARRIGVTPKALVAQAALETGWGRSAIDHNLFNIKADASWKGPSIVVPTREVIDGQSVMIDAPFRVYDSYEASIEDHFVFLWGNTRYAAAGVFNPPSDAAFFQALKNAGYATDPDYVASLIAVEATVTSFVSTMAVDAGALPAVTPPPQLDAPDLPNAFHILMVGCHGDDVKVLQAKLGFGGADIDGWFGNQTYFGVRAWQRAHPPLAVDGVVGRLTAAALGMTSA